MGGDLAVERRHDPHFACPKAISIRAPDGSELKALDRASQDARDLHLRQPNRRRNVGLGPVLDEAHVQNQAFAHRKLPARRLECEPLVGELIVVVDRPNRLRQRLRLPLLLDPNRKCDD
jgi:hypothetical protein